MSDAFTLDSLRQTLGGRPFRFYEQIGSTQDAAYEWALADPDLPGQRTAVVITEEQTAGRGRQENPCIPPPPMAGPVPAAIPEKYSHFWTYHVDSRPDGRYIDLFVKEYAFLPRSLPFT